MIEKMKRDTLIGFKVNDYENKVIRQKARACKVNISVFLRASALAKEIVVIEGLSDLLPQLMRIGNNLNQLTVMMRQNRITSPDLMIIKKEFATFVHESREVLNKK